MRIGIVNDLAMAREALRRVVRRGAGPRGRLDGRRRARGGREGPARPPRPDPDGPDHAGVDGVEATRRIMAESPLPDPGRHRARSAATSDRSTRRWATGRSTRSTPRPSARAATSRARGRAREDRHGRQAHRQVARARRRLGRSPDLAAGSRRQRARRRPLIVRSAPRPAARRRSRRSWGPAADTGDAAW